MEWNQSTIFMEWEWNEVKLIEGMELAEAPSGSQSMEFMELIDGAPAAAPHKR